MRGSQRKCSWIVAYGALDNRASVLECASPLALWFAAGRGLEKRRKTAALSRGGGTAASRLARQLELGAHSRGEEGYVAFPVITELCRVAA